MADPKSKDYWIDTNIVIRFVTNDHAEMSPEVAALMQQAEHGLLTLRIHPLVIAECCWVLQSSHYQFTPADIASVLASFVTAKGIEAEDLNLVLKALDDYATCRVDFVDAYLAAVADNSKSPVITYNIKDFQKLTESHLQPVQVVRDSE